jgi:predicted transcriptional regulator
MVRSSGAKEEWDDLLPVATPALGNCWISLTTALEYGSRVRPRQQPIHHLIRDCIFPVRRHTSSFISFSTRPFSEVMGDFAKTFEAVRSGQRIPKGVRQEVGFTSIEAARNFLTRERLALLRTIRSRHPDSLYELPKMVGRDFKNVQEDIGILERNGLVRITKQPLGKRKVKVPQVPFEEIALRIAI